MSPTEKTSVYWSAWFSACNSIFSEDVRTAVEGLSFAENCIHISNTEEPFIEATVSLRRAQIQHYREHVKVANTSDKTHTASNARETDWCHSVQSMYAMAIVRMVNFVTDRDFRVYSLAESLRMKSIHNSVRERAQERKLPQELVEVRHAATHSTMPPLSQLVLSCCLALAYLEAHYWVPIYNKNFSQRKYTSLSQGIESSATSHSSTPSLFTVPELAHAEKQIISTYPDLCSRRLKRPRKRKSCLSKRDLGKQVEIKVSSHVSFVGETNMDNVDTIELINREKLSSMDVPLPPGFFFSK